MKTLIILCLLALIGCSSTNTRKIIAGKEHRVTEKKCMGLTLSRRVEPIPSKSQTLKDQLTKPAKYANWIGLFAMLIGAGVAIAFRDPFLSGIGKKAATIGVAMYAGSLPVLYVVNWLTWFLLGGVILAVGYLIYRTRRVGIDKVLKKGLRKIREQEPTGRWRTKQERPTSMQE